MNLVTPGIKAGRFNQIWHMQLIFTYLHKIKEKLFKKLTV